MSTPADAPVSGTIYVCSGNPAKLRAAEEGFQRMFPEGKFTFKTIKVPSGVADQPSSDEETLRGALNRAQTAREKEPDGDFWIGIEGGVDDAGVKDGPITVMAWIAVVDKNGKVGRARTGAFYVPEEMAKLLREGLELAHADEQLHGVSNSRQRNGTVGILTGDVLSITGFYSEAVITSLIPFKNKHLTFV